MDRDSDGYLSQADLQKTPDFTLAKAQKLRDYDADQNNLIDFGEFVKALYNVDKEMFLESFEGFDPVDIQLEFDKYSVVDEASPTKKHIPESRVELIMQHNKFTCITAPDIKRLFKELDVNGDGVIDFSDFQQVQFRCAAVCATIHLTPATLEDILVYTLKSKAADVFTLDVPIFKELIV